MSASISSEARTGIVRRTRPDGGFTILEVVIATGIVAFTLGAIYTTHWKTLSIIRSAHRSVNASQVLQEKAEILRSLSWSKLTNSSFVSGTSCLGGPVTVSEQQVQSISTLVETITMTETPPPVSGTAGGYSITRTISYPLSNGAPSCSGTVASSVAFSPSACRMQGSLRVSWTLNGPSNSLPGSREFEMAISNPPQ